MSIKVIFSLGLFLIINLIPVIGAYFGQWSWEGILYFYWGECVLFGLFTLFFYAKHLIVFCIILAAVAAILSLADLPFWSDLRLPITFWSLYSLCWLFYFEISKSMLGLAIRRLAPWARLSIYFAFMSLVAGGCLFMTISMYNEWAMIALMPFKIKALLISMIALVPTLTIGLLRVIDMIGARHFIHFLIGTYHRPIEKEKVVLFLDMVGSSGMAEKIMPRKSMALIARFIFDAGATFRLHGGDIVNYTGDGLVVLWPTSQADRALQSAETLHSQLEKSTAYYKKKFGFIPDFRIGLHAGDVVISQIGEEKLFLGLYGDVVNTAARLEALNKELGTRVLFSKSVQQRLSQHMQSRSAPLGLKDIKGRTGNVEVFTLKSNMAIQGDKSVKIQTAKP